jgi:hypothetical protein
MVDGTAAQITVTVEGRVVERGGAAGIRGATVELTGRSVVSTGASGDFRFGELRTGRYVMRVEALGYAERELVLVLERDTSLVIELEPAPILLDSLAVRGRTVTVLGHVTESGSGDNMIHVEVASGTGETTRTNATGRFELSRFPAGPPESITVREMGYLPATLILTAGKDTSISIEMKPDGLAQRMIEVQIARLEKRSRPFRSPRFPVIGREELLWMRNATVLDVVKRWYGPFINGVQCILIDDEQNDNGLAGLTMIYPDELERIEVLRSGAMLRLYTRRFIAKMMAGGVVLRQPVLAPGAIHSLCR